MLLTEATVNRSTVFRFLVFLFHRISVHLLFFLHWGISKFCFYPFIQCRLLNIPVDGKGNLNQKERLKLVYSLDTKGKAKQSVKSVHPAYCCTFVLKNGNALKLNFTFQCPRMKRYKQLALHNIVSFCLHFPMSYVGRHCVSFIMMLRTEARFTNNRFISVVLEKDILLLESSLDAIFWQDRLISCYQITSSPRHEIRLDEWILVASLLLKYFLQYTVYILNLENTN